MLRLSVANLQAFLARLARLRCFLGLSGSYYERAAGMNHTVHRVTGLVFMKAQTLRYRSCIHESRDAVR